MAMAEVSIVPVGTRTPSLSKYVAGAVRVLQAEKDLKYRITDMGTIIEGEVERVLGVVARMHRSAFDAGAVRVVTSIRIDERRDKPSGIGTKVESVERQLGLK
ncbi:MAG: MTH1187 family thiamine-binding protein [Chloroflexi bacterium]|nr:MTH1187 family thiamine-binding protein [Chloroflexota bacterium]